MYWSWYLLFVYADSERTSEGTIGVWDFGFSQASGIPTIIRDRWNPNSYLSLLMNFCYELPKSKHKYICFYFSFILTRIQIGVFFFREALETLVKIANARSLILEAHGVLQKDIKSTKEWQKGQVLTLQNNVAEPNDIIDVSS